MSARSALSEYGGEMKTAAKHEVAKMKRYRKKRKMKNSWHMAAWRSAKMKRGISAKSALGIGVSREMHGAHGGAARRQRRVAWQQRRYQWRRGALGGA